MGRAKTPTPRGKARGLSGLRTMEQGQRPRRRSPGESDPRRSIAPRVPVSLQHFWVPSSPSGNCPAETALPSGVLVLVWQWTDWTREASTT